jgi:hypothetical protein
MRHGASMEARGAARLGGLAVWTSLSAMQKRPGLLAFFDAAASGAPRSWAELEQEIAAFGAADLADVRFGGGEPTQSPHLLLALQACRKASLRVALDTDARVLGTGERAALLRDAGLSRIFVRLSGSSAKTHDAVHGPSAFTQTLRGARRAKQAGLLVDLVFLLDRQNAAELPGAVELARALSVNALRLELADDASTTLSEELLGAVLDAVRASLLLQVRLKKAATFPAISADDVLSRSRQALDSLVYALFESGFVDRPRLPLYALGGDGQTAGFASALQRAGGVSELCHTLAAWGAPLVDLPACLGGQGTPRPERAKAESVKHARCAGCPLDAQCRGADAALGATVHSLMAPRHEWLAKPHGPRAELLGLESVAPHERDRTYVLLAEELARLGLSTTRTVADADAASAAEPPPLRIFANFASLAKNLPQLKGDGGAGVVLDFHLLNGIDELRAACGAAEPANQGAGGRRRAPLAWPSNVGVVSCFPGYATLYQRAGVPLDCISWRSYPLHLGPGPQPLPVLEAKSIACGGNHLRDWATFDAAMQLSRGSLPIEAFGETDLNPTPTRARYHGEVPMEEFWSALAQSRFVIVPLYLDWRRAAGISVIAMAMALGRPIIASRIPAAEDHLVHGEDSLLVPPGNARALAEAMDLLEHDASLCERLAAGARKNREKLLPSGLARWLVHGTPPPSASGLSAAPGPYRAW